MGLSFTLLKKLRINQDDLKSEDSLDQFSNVGKKEDVCALLILIVRMRGDQAIRNNNKWEQTFFF